jgi:putative acetyltransferase
VPPDRVDDPATAAKAEPATAPAAKALSDDDFADVDFDALNYQSDYGRFLQAGVPERIRQKALGKLWLSDPIFTQVDPFQDYAGDYTDAATVPKGLLRTAYKFGQGHLSDEEAHTWDRLGKGDVAPEIAALAILKPGYRVRAATADDAAVLLGVRRAAILGLGPDVLGPDAAASWAHELSVEGHANAIADGEQIEVAIDDERGAIVAWLGRKDDAITALFVQPGHGRRGLASRLLDRAHAALRGDGRTHARLVTMGHARAFYQRHGWRVTAERTGPTRGGIDVPVLEMTRWLIVPEAVAIDAETPDQPAVAAFLAASEAYASALYPAESNHFAPLATLLQPNVLFLVARADGVAVGCGAVMRAGDGSAELKRMWIDPAARGLKLGARLLEALERAAREDGVAVLRLETGIHNAEALGLYRRAGFVEIPPFADYLADPLSVFMEKPL